LRIESSVFSIDDGVAFHPTAQEHERTDSRALAARNLSADAFAFDSRGAKFIIRDGNGDRYRWYRGICFRGCGCFRTRASPQKPIP
jgi:hypothetical protein